MDSLVPQQLVEEAKAIVAANHGEGHGTSHELLLIMLKKVPILKRLLMILMPLTVKMTHIMIRPYRFTRCQMTSMFFTS